jgi:hypothetical protein
MIKPDLKIDFMAAWVLESFELQTTHKGLKCTRIKHRALHHIATGQAKRNAHLSNLFTSFCAFILFSGDEKAGEINHSKGKLRTSVGVGM